MNETKTPEDFGLTKNKWTELGMYNAVKWLIQKVSSQDIEIARLKNQLAEKNKKSDYV